MISHLVALLLKGVHHVKDHPQIFFVLILLIVFPFLFLYTGQQFLDVGRANQETLQQQRIGLMHDVFSSLVSTSGANKDEVGSEFAQLAVLNPDIVDYKVLVKDEDKLISIIAKNPDEIGKEEEFSDIYKNAAIRTDESLIFETSNGTERFWDAYRVAEVQNGSLYFIHTRLSLQAIDALFKSREQAAYFSLVFVYFFIIALAYWHIRLTDYRYLYIAAQKTNETKDLFTNMIAHELRAPLTAIRGYASLIEEKADAQAQKQYAIRVRESSERLIAIVNDLLDVARIQSGKIAVESVPVDISPLVAEVIDELRVSAKEKDITLSYTIKGNDFVVKADKNRLHQALVNLVSNAIKYTPHGAITLALEERLGLVELRVKDTGMGIAADDQKKLFAPFFRVANDDVSKVTGTGLGMWITKQFVELMGGKVSVESIKEVGTHVVVTLEKPH